VPEPSPAALFAGVLLALLFRTGKLRRELANRRTSIELKI